MGIGATPEERLKKAAAGMIGKHKRWHVNRNKPNPQCPLCSKDFASTNVADKTAAYTSRKEVPN